jgi:hypothetical protein
VLYEEGVAGNAVAPSLPVVGKNRLLAVNEAFARFINALNTRACFCDSSTVACRYGLIVEGDRPLWSASEDRCWFERRRAASISEAVCENSMYTSTINPTALCKSVATSASSDFIISVVARVIQ